MRILIAEDEGATRETYRAILESDGHAVTVTSNGRECLEVFRNDRQRYDVIILDYRMPVNDGIFVLNEILRSAPDQRVIVATAYPLDQVRSLDRFSQNIAWVQKPFDLVTLSNMVCTFYDKP